MAKILLGVSILLMLLTAGLGFITKSKVSELQNNLSDAKQNLVAATTSMNGAKTAQKQAEEKLAAANAKVDEQAKDVAKAKSDVDAINAKLKDASEDVEKKTKELADIQIVLDKIPKDSTGVGSENIAARMNEMQAKLQRAETERDEAVQLKSALESRAQAAEEKFAVADRQVKDYKGNISRPGISGRVLAYNPGWNFAVLSIGDQQGLKANAQLLVMRGNQAIAKLRVTSVEPRSSIADVIPGTLARGQTVQPGDTVIFEGRR